MHSPNRLSLHHLHIARFTIEAQSGFSLASGLTDLSFDNLVVRDANGLPAIPGTSLAGVVRSEYENHYVSAAAEDRLNLARLFGDHLKKSKTIETEESIKSRVEFSWGVIHNGDNVPVEGLQLIENNDVLLKFLQQDHPIVRDRVRINEWGTAEHQAKFDKTTIPRGTRFSAEMALWAEEAEPVEWMRLCHLLAERPLRLGGSAGIGMGLFKCISMKCKSFDLTKSEDYDMYALLDPSFNATATADWKGFESDAETLE